MYCKRLLPLACAFLSLSLSSAPGWAKENKRSYEKSVFIGSAALPANKTAIAQTQMEIAANFPGWRSTTDKICGSFTDIYGAPVDLNGATNREKAENCMTGKLKSLGVTQSEWKFITNIAAPKANYVNYSQVINNHPVIFSRLSFRFTKIDELARIQMKNYGHPATGLTPTVSKDRAKEVAIADIDDNTVISEATIADDWSWFPIPSAGGYTLHPAWSFTVKGRVPGEVPLKLTGYIDAVTGTMLYRTNEIRTTGYDLTVKGVVYRNGTLNPATNEPLVDLDLDAGSSVYHTDTGGRYHDISLSIPLSTDVPLSGKWSIVIDSPTGLTPLFNTVVTGTSTYTYPTTVPSSSRHINAYYHTTRIHNFMKNYFTTFTDLDTPLPTNVDLTSGTCNAFFAGPSINFFAAGGGCNSFAEMGDVVYHEYGHAINASFYSYISGTAMMNPALHEADADIWALSVTHDPVLARNAFVGYGGFIRRYDMTPQVYPIDLDPTAGDPHKTGQIIAGCWWDVGTALGSYDSMTRLFTDVFYDYPDGPWGSEGYIYQTILIDALMADDNDANLSNGTPHYAQIVGAFARHGIYLEGDADMAHFELPVQPADVPIHVDASLALTSTAFFRNLILQYRTNSTGAWTPVTMTNTSFNFSGTIPAQPMGTVVEYYFVAMDSLNVPNAYFPLTCNPTMSSLQTTLPYQFGVGIKAVDSNTFEGSVSGYGIGSNPGDDAAFGLWVQAHPGVELTSDHTTGFGQCLFAASILSSGSGGTMGGTTTIVTPIFNIGSLYKPVVEYYRWFANAGGYENFKSDPWIVKIRDASGSTWQTIENTYQCDTTWRRRIIPVKAFLPATATQMQLKFFASDSTLPTWNVDGQNGMVTAMDDLFIYDTGFVPVGVAAVPAARSVIFPNPADETINARIPDGSKGMMSLWDMASRKIEEQPITETVTDYSFSTRNLAQGPYNLLIETKNSIQMKKIVVVHR